MKKTPLVCFLFRVAIGGLFVYSGFSKLMEPLSNFVGVILGYLIIGPRLAFWAAQVLPWAELLAGTFFLLGLWTRQSLAVIALMCAVFFAAILSTYWRGIPLHDCGCFGNGAQALPLWTTLALDGLMLLGLSWMYWKKDETLFLSLDKSLKA